MTEVLEVGSRNAEVGIKEFGNRNESNSEGGMRKAEKENVEGKTLIRTE